MQFVHCAGDVVKSQRTFRAWHPVQARAARGDRSNLCMPLNMEAHEATSDQSLPCAEGMLYVSRRNEVHATREEPKALTRQLPYAV